MISLLTIDIIVGFLPTIYCGKKSDCSHDFVFFKNGGKQRKEHRKLFQVPGACAWKVRLDGRRNEFAGRFENLGIS